MQFVVVVNAISVGRLVGVAIDVVCVIVVMVEHVATGGGSGTGTTGAFKTGPLTSFGFLNSSNHSPRAVFNAEVGW